MSQININPNTTNFCSFSYSSCWITQGNGANWAFHGPVIAVVTVSSVPTKFVLTDYGNQLTDQHHTTSDGNGDHYKSSP